MSGALRPLAYHLMSHRDGFAGWTRHRTAFATLASQSAAEIRQYSLGALQQLLAHAFATVPYYREAWSSIGFAPSTRVALDDLRRLPVLTKADIRERKADL